MIDTGDILALIAVRAGYQAGEATVTVKAEGLEPVEISVRVMERQGFFREDFSSPS